MCARSLFESRKSSGSLTSSSASRGWLFRRGTSSSVRGNNYIVTRCSSGLTRHLISLRHGLRWKTSRTTRDHWRTFLVRIGCRTSSSLPVQLYVPKRFRPNVKPCGSTGSGERKRRCPSAPSLVSGERRSSWHAGLLHGGMPIRERGRYSEELRGALLHSIDLSPSYSENPLSVCPAVGGVRSARRTRSSVVTEGCGLDSPRRLL